jgi:hypothetical protein
MLGDVYFARKAIVPVVKFLFIQPHATRKITLVGSDDMLILARL